MKILLKVKRKMTHKTNPYMGRTQWNIYAYVRTCLHWEFTGTDRPIAS